MPQRPKVPVPHEVLARICSRYQVRELAIFGSAARGEIRPDSDVDLLVVFAEDARIGLIMLARLQRELAAAFGRDVDLVPKDGLKPAIRDEVLAQAHTLYAA